MFDVDRILAIPELEPDAIQMGISGGARAELKDRGFIRKDGIKAKDYMIRTIQKTAKNKEKAEKAVIKGDKKLENRLQEIEKELATPYLVGAKYKPLVVSNPGRFEALRQESKQIQSALGKKNREFYENTQDQAQRLLRMPPERHKKYVEAALEKGLNVPSEVLKDYPDLAKQYSRSSTRGLQVTYNKQGDLSANSVAAKAKKAISGQSKGGKVVKGGKPSDRGIPVEASKFVKESNKNHTVFYNGKVVNMDYLNKKPKDEFKFAGMRIADNLNTGGVGFIKTPKGEYYQVSNANRSAKKVTEKEVLDSVRQSKLKQPSAAAKKLGLTADQEAEMRKKVKRL